MLKTRIPPPWYVLFAAMLMYGFHRYLPGPALPGPRFSRLAWLVTASGFALTAWAGVTFRRARTTIDPTAPSKASRLVTHGPYRFTRNPMYLGFLLVLTGWAVWLSSPAGFVVLPVFVAAITVLQISPEEQALHGLFGEDYVCYCRQVNRWLGRQGVGGVKLPAAGDRRFPQC